MCNCNCKHLASSANESRNKQKIRYFTPDIVYCLQTRRLYFREALGTSSQRFELQTQFCRSTRPWVDVIHCYTIGFAPQEATMADAAPAVVPVAADHDAALAPENAPELPNNEDQDVDPTASAGPAKKSLLKGLTGGVTASLKNVAKQMQTGIEQINHGIKDNISTATASMSHAAAAASGAAAQSMASAFTVSSSWSQPPLDRTASQVTEAVYRTRDLRKSTESVSKRFLAREVDYAGIAAGGYNKTMKEVSAEARFNPTDTIGWYRVPARLIRRCATSCRSGVVHGMTMYQSLPAQPHSRRSKIPKPYCGRCTTVSGL